MKLYLASIYSDNVHLTGQTCRQMTPNEFKHRQNVRWLLESYHYIHRQRYVDLLRKDGIKIFLDSGAFSSFTKGVEVDLPAYCEYIKRNQDIIEVVDGIMVASVLDCVGDPLKTYQNQLEMERLGVRPLPCFHYGDDERYLEYYIDNYPYITLGGMVPIAAPQLEIWLDRIWSKYLTKSDGSPKLKVHGFGMTTISLMERYPWFSVDSSSWVQYAAFGWIYIPGQGSILISKHSPNIKKANGHILTIAPLQRETLRKMIEDAGFDFERLQQTWVARATFNMHAFRLFEDRCNAKECRFFASQEVFF